MIWSTVDPTSNYLVRDLPSRTKMINYRRALMLFGRLVLEKMVRDIDRELARVPFQDSQLNEMYQYAVSKGRRTRPLFILAGCRAVGGSTSKALPMALAMELMHQASLIVDDIVDQDNVRRGRRAFHVQYGYSNAVHMSDLLIALSYQKLQVLDQTHEPELVSACQSLLSNVYRTACIGAIKELLSSGIPLSEKDTLTIAYEKTALALESCFRVGGILGNGNDQEIKALAAYGRSVGLAYQLMNDLDNLAGGRYSRDRPPRADIWAGRVTFPIAYALDHVSLHDRQQLISFLDKDVSDKDLVQAAEIVQASGAILSTEKQVKVFLNDARASLGPLRRSMTKRMMFEVTYLMGDPRYWGDSGRLRNLVRRKRPGISND